MYVESKKKQDNTATNSLPEAENYQFDKVNLWANTPDYSSKNDNVNFIEQFGISPEESFTSVPPLQGKGFRDKRPITQQVGGGYFGGIGKRLGLSGEMSENIQKSFGLDPKTIELRESPEVAKIGAKATAQGNVIRFAPGEFKPNTQEGRKVLGHELNHVREQAQGKIKANIAGTNIHYDPANEASSDRAGEAFASGTMGDASPVSVGNANVGGAPVQGFSKDEQGFLQGNEHLGNILRVAEAPIKAVDVGRRALGGVTGGLAGAVTGRVTGALRGAETGRGIGSTVGRLGGKGIGAVTGAIGGAVSGAQDGGGLLGAARGFFSGGRSGAERGAEVGDSVGTGVGGVLGGLAGAATGRLTGAVRGAIGGASVGEDKKTDEQAGGALGGIYNAARGTAVGNAMTRVESWAQDTTENTSSWFGRPDAELLKRETWQADETDISGVTDAMQDLGQNRELAGLPKKKKIPKGPAPYDPFRPIDRQIAKLGKKARGAVDTVKGLPGRAIKGIDKSISKSTRFGGAAKSIKSRVNNMKRSVNKGVKNANSWADKKIQQNTFKNQRSFKRSTKATKGKGTLNKIDNAARKMSKGFKKAGGAAKFVGKAGDKLGTLRKGVKVGQAFHKNGAWGDEGGLQVAAEQVGAKKGMKAGGKAGAAVGKKVGAVLGSFIPIPIVGTALGAAVGGIAGGFIGSRLGSAGGEAIGSAVGNGARAIGRGAKAVGGAIGGAVGGAARAANRAARAIGGFFRGNRDD